jgi:Concanavalin A-like lectin/glucanases superfamily
MAGPRKAEYVSIPLGPGVLSNTTGRGAKTRINYMNWDRWQDASWVRWHKLLPEKQGGWAFQSLLGQSVFPPVVRGSPDLLLHLNNSPIPFPSSLLLHMDGANGSTSFPDSSGNGLNGVVGNGSNGTGSGLVSVSTSIFKFGTGSANFSGTGTLAIPFVPGGPLDTSSGDFTIEFWLNAPAQTQHSLARFARLAGTNENGPGLLIQNASAGNLQINFAADGNWSLAAGVTTGPFPVNTWIHFALVFNSGTGFLAMYLNGVLVANQVGLIRGSMASVFSYYLGYFPAIDSGSGFVGFIDDFRLTQEAVYTNNFTPPTGPLSATVQTPALNLTDSSPFRFPIQLNSTGGSATVSPTTFEFGNGSLQTNGTAGASVSTPIVPGGPLDLSQGDFTIEFWANSQNENNNLFLDMSNGGTSGLYFKQPTSANIEVHIWTGSAFVVLTGALAQNAFAAIALVRQGATFTLYVNGVAQANMTYTGSITMLGTLFIGGGFLVSLLGFIDEVRITSLALYTANYTPATTEGTLGLPNVLGSANPPNAFIPSTYLGIARAVHDWSSIDGQFWIAIGTHLKLYVVNQGTLYDITPSRKTSNLANAITTVNGSNVVTIVDAGHQASTGDFVSVNGAAEVAGVVVNGPYQIVVVDPNTYTIVATVPAIAAASGGGSFSVAYDIGAGLPANGQLLGYGTGPYGIGTYGTPRPPGTGVFARMRNWSLDNFGQDLIASQSDGEIYWWQKNSGPNSRAGLLANAPQGVQRVIVDANQRVIIALGCTDVTSAFNAVLVRWCSFNNITDWFPTDVNTAGDDFLPSGSRIITGIKTKGQNLIWTDTTLYRMVFVGAPDDYEFIPSGEVVIVGPNAAVDVDGVAYFMGFDNIYNYSGTLNLQACEVWDTVFDPTLPTSLNRAQSEGVVCYTYEPKTEITWLYQSIGGAFVVTFTAGLAQGATAGTLTAPWAGATGLYDLQFADQEAQPVQLTNGSTAASWGLPLTGAVGAQATFIGNDRYVTFNWDDGTWYCGTWNRTCANGRAAAMGGFPYGVNAGYLYQHEIGTDAIEASGTNALPFFMKSLDITIGGAKSEYTMGGSDARFTIGGSDAHLLVRSMLPDWKYFTGQMNLTLFTKDRPQDPAYVQSGPVTFDATTGQIDIDAHGSQLVIQMDNLTAQGGAPSLGCSFRMGIFQGLAVPYAKR